MTEIKLKPCPFCGGKAEFGTNPFYRTIRVYCSKCKAASSQSESNVYNCAAEDAANAWNKRTEILKHGEWELVNSCEDENGDLVNMYSCSKCTAVSDEPTDYCPKCGAKMDGGNENELDRRR